MRVNDGVSSRRPELSAAKQTPLDKWLRGELAGPAPAPTIPRRAGSGPTPLSSAQQRIWFFYQLKPDIPLYNLPVAFRLKGYLHQTALKQALLAIVSRHEALRTRFISQDGNPVQIVDPPSPAPLPLIDLSEAPESQREAQLQQLLVQKARRPFDLSCDLMLRSVLFRLGEREHVLLLVVHHIASDGWSMSILFRELSIFYNACAEGQSVALPDLPIQYADFAVWQLQRLQGDFFEKQLAYWRQALTGAPDLLDLPNDKPRPVTQTFHGASDSFALARPLREALKSLSRAEGVTLFMTLLAAFKTLLYRYSRQADILVGTPIAGRSQIETENLIGFFINTLVLRTLLDARLTFRQLMRKVRDVTLDAFEHQELPFEKLVEALKPERSSSHSPLIQVMFAFQNVLSENLRFSGLDVDPIELELGTAKFDLTLAIRETPNGFSGLIEYNSDLFQPATIQRMIGHYRTLLEAISRDPDLRLAELPLLTEPERRQLLLSWNSTQTDYPRDKCIHQLFQEQVERSPKAVAVVWDPESLTYEELNARANQLAHYLRTLGVGPEVCVGVFLERSLELVVAWLAVIKAGGVYVPLDTTYPEQRLAFMLRDTCAPVLLTQSHLLGRWGHPAARIVKLDEAVTVSALRAQPSANLANQTTSEHALYVIYTSGSTGGPKGVCVPHRAVNRLVMETDYVRLTASDVIAQISNSSFDAATFEVWGALLRGARLVIVPQDTLLSARHFAQLLEDRGITAMFITTALFNQLSREVLDIFRSVRHLLFGGEAVTPPYVAEVLRHGRPERLLHVYGPTETTTFATWHEIEAVPDTASTIPIGRPIANTQTYVLDPYLNPVPIGVYGELYIGGPGLAHGYLNQPELTAERFVAHPFSRAPGARLYRTGDLVRYLPNGDLEFLGRTDFQVKIRGFRVELGEIETALSRHPAVRQAVVVAHKTSSGEKSLAAYLVPDGSPASPSQLREFLLARLPDYMVPAWFIILDTLPLNQNGKVDRHRLPPPEQTTSDTPRAIDGGRDWWEQQLVSIWEDVLDRHPVGIQDNFFELGGHSLLAVRLAAEIEKKLERKIAIASIFNAPTIVQLAALLRVPDPPAPGSLLVEIQPKGSNPPLVLVHGVGGGMFWGYANLARHLGCDQPLYGLRARGAEELETTPRIEDMAAEYIRALRTFQPSGPYYLGGYCFGGNIAYEMARQLQLQGHSVGLLLLINCSPPNSSYTRIAFTPVYWFKFLCNLGWWTADFLRRNSAHKRKYLRWKTRLLAKRIQRLFHAAFRNATHLDADQLADLSPHSESERRLWAMHIRALANHRAQPYPGRLSLFRTRGHPVFSSFDPQYGWGDLAEKGVAVQVAPGAHESILEEPHVRVLAARIADCLRAAHLAELAPVPQPKINHHQIPI